MGSLPGRYLVSRLISTEPMRKRLQKTLRSDIDAEAWASLYSTTSRPFPKPKSGHTPSKWSTTMATKSSRSTKSKDASQTHISNHVNGASRFDLEAPFFSTDRYRYFYRHPVVEVRGIEPRSAESFTPASPSAAISEHSVVGTLMASFPTSYLRLIFGFRSQTPEAASYESDVWIRAGRRLPVRRAVY